jgi:hypothetical protein
VIPRCLAIAVAAALLLMPRIARADDTQKPSYRLVIDSVDNEPSVLGGTRVSIHLTAITLQGQRLDLSDSSSIKTYVGNSELKAPFAEGLFRNTREDTAIVVVVQATLDYQDVLPTILDSLDTTLLAQLDDKTQFTVLPYGESVGTGKLLALKAGRAKLKEVTQDNFAGEPALIETVERAMLLLKKAKPAHEGDDIRKIIILIGDGRDRNADKDRVTRLGARAAKEGVRIHTLAYSPTDQRRPLLLLGELSRKSLGTFRWLQLAQADSWNAKFAQLLDEIDRQYVLTYFLGPDDDLGGKKIHVTTVGRTEATSPDAKVPTAGCNTEPCAGYCNGATCVIPQLRKGRGFFGWILLIGGVAVGGVLVLGFIGFLMSKKQPPPQLPPGFVPPPGWVAPGSKPPKKEKKPKSVPPPGASTSFPGVLPGAVPGGAPPVAPAVAGRVQPFLMFMSGPRTGERIALHHGFIIGKAPNCHLVIEDGYTSTYHVQIGVDHVGNARLFDQQSTNGTFVNGVRVTEYALENGVTVRIGATDFRFLAQ